MTKQKYQNSFHRYDADICGEYSKHKVHLKKKKDIFFLNLYCIVTVEEAMTCNKWAQVGFEPGPLGYGLGHSTWGAHSTYCANRYPFKV